MLQDVFTSSTIRGGDDAPGCLYFQYYKGWG